MSVLTTITTEAKVVDFERPELCTGCDPVTCTVEGNDYSGGNWRDVLVSLIETFLTTKPNSQELLYKSLNKNGKRPFLLEKRPHHQSVTASRQLSNGYWVYLHLSIKDLVVTIGKLCEFCGVDLNNVRITYTPKKGEVKTRAIDKTEVASARFAQQPVREAFRAWLMKRNPEWSYGTISMHYSAAYYLHSHHCGVTLEEALTANDGLLKAYDAIERFYTDNPVYSSTPSVLARSYLRSLRMLKEFLVENYPHLLDEKARVSVTSVPEVVIEALNKHFTSGFRFDTTCINLLTSASGVNVDRRMQVELKRMMFHRDDDIYFLFDTVVDANTRKDIIDFADCYLEEYGCFEISEFYKLYEDKVNPGCIRNANDFESFYEQIGKSGVRCVQAPHIGNRIARYSSGSVWNTFREVAARIVAVISEEHYGSCSEDDLHSKFFALSTDLLGKIIRHCAADSLIRVEINGTICYQTFDALSLPENFSEVLAGVLGRLDDIGLEPAQNTLHTAISLELGINLMAELNLPDWETFRRLTATFYKTEPRREWKANIFGEVTV